jgi:hypothetical protein
VASNGRTEWGPGEGGEIQLAATVDTNAQTDAGTHRASSCKCMPVPSVGCKCHMGAGNPPVCVCVYLDAKSAGHSLAIRHDSGDVNAGGAHPVPADTFTIPADTVCTLTSDGWVPTRSTGVWLLRRQSRCGQVMQRKYRSVTGLTYPRTQQGQAPCTASCAPLHPPGTHMTCKVKPTAEV